MPLLSLLHLPVFPAGEPFNIEASDGGSEPFDVTIEYNGRALMLASSSHGRWRDEPSAVHAIDEALAAGTINVQQREALLEALS